jgi:hypothetical protein
MKQEDAKVEDRVKLISAFNSLFKVKEGALKEQLKQRMAVIVM